MGSFVSQSLCRNSTISLKTRALLRCGSNGNVLCMLFDIYLLKVTWIPSQRCNIWPFNKRSDVISLKVRSSTSVHENCILGYITSIKPPRPQAFLPWRKKFGSRVKQISRKCNIKNLDTLSSFRKKDRKTKLWIIYQTLVLRFFVFKY